MQYIVFIHKNSESTPSTQDWSRFIDLALASGMFKGGSEIGLRQAIGSKRVTDTTESIGGFMRFDSDDLHKLQTLLNNHPVVQHGGTVELCEMPRS